MMVVTVAPFENTHCSMPPSTATIASNENADPKGGFIFEGSDYYDEPNMFNVTDHSGISLGSDSEEFQNNDPTLDTTCLASSGEADYFVGEGQDLKTLDEESQHDLDAVALIHLDRIQVQGGVPSQSQAFFNPELNSSSRGFHDSSQVSDASGHHEINQAFGLESLSVVDGTRNSVAPDASKSQVLDHYEIERVFENSETERNSIANVSTAGQVIGNSSSAYLTCDKWSSSKPGVEGIVSDYHGDACPHQNNHHLDKLEPPVEECQTGGTGERVLKQDCWQKVEGYLGLESESLKSLNVEDAKDFPEESHWKDNYFVTTSKLNNHCDNNHHVGIILHEKEGTGTATNEDEHITQVHEKVHISTPMGDTQATGKREVWVEPASMNSSFPSNSYESNDDRLEEGSQKHVLYLDSHEGSTRVMASDLESSLLSFSHEYAERSPLSEVDHGLNVPQDCREEDEIREAMPLMGKDILESDSLSVGNSQSCTHEDEKREAMSLEMGHGVLESNNSDSSSVSLAKRKAGSVEPCRQTLGVDAQVSDSNDLRSGEHEASTKAAEQAPQNFFPDTKDSGKMHQTIILAELMSGSTEPRNETLGSNAKVSHLNDLRDGDCESSKKAADDAEWNSRQENRDTDKIGQQESILEPANFGIASTSGAKDESAFKIADFFDNARVVSTEKHGTKEQEHTTGTVALGLPVKTKHINESPNSLRALLSSEGRMGLEKGGKPTLLNDTVRKDGRVPEHMQRLAPSTESSIVVNHLSQEESHTFPEKWYENAENEDFTSATFSGPIAFSGTIAYSGAIAYSGPIPYSGSISHRSDSSTSTRSFAFPILASDWNSSPAKMAQPDSRFFRRRRRWRFCFCCKRTSTLFD